MQQAAIIGRTSARRRLLLASASLLGLLACAAVALALSASPAFAAEGEGCPNEQERSESDINPGTEQAYSFGLLECRAYEMVSPLNKQAHGAAGLDGLGIPVAPNGNTIGFGSEGDFAEPEDYRVNFLPENDYQAQRTPLGWITSSSFAPRDDVDDPFLNGFDGDYSRDLRSEQVSCGTNPIGKGEGKGQAVACATRKSGGPWTESALHISVDGNPVEGVGGFLGSSSDLSRVFFQPGDDLLSTDTIAQTSDGIYELEFADPGAGTPEELRLVNVGDSGEELSNEESGFATGPLLGDFRATPKVEGTTYHAISESGEKVFFVATPKKGPDAGVETLYARVDHTETVTISESECTTCTGEAKPVTFQGASADGSKVFFTTEQQLVNSDTDTTTDLYEYDFEKPEGERLIQISESPTPGVAAEVQGVLRTSSDGSHVYFAALGVLTSEPNKDDEFAVAGQNNLYGYDTVTGQIKFVADLSGAHDNVLWGEVHGETSNDDSSREVQTTPDGRYLVFSSGAQLAGDLNKPGHQAVYRYDFESGELTWVSHGATGFTYKGEGLNATVSRLDGGIEGADASVDDSSRAISGCPHPVTENAEEQKTEEEQCPEGKYDGEFIVFSTPEKLQAHDEDGTSNVYVWHNGTVSMISDGQGAKRTNFITEPAPRETGMSASGSDVFFTTSTQLVGQDTDTLEDVYDARVDGGFEAPQEPEECSGEGCQGRPSPPQSFPSAVSSLVTAGGNLTAPVGGVLSIKTSTPPPPTRAQELAKALKACKGDKKKTKRAACESQARKKYGSTAKAKAKAKKSGRGGK